MKKIKLNVLLAKTDSLAPQFKGALNDFSKFFAKSQGSFLGEKKTYEQREGTIDVPSNRGNLLVQTTVDEKFTWFKENSKEYIDSLFSQEKTNASGLAKAELIVDGESWGELTSLELLRLKNLVESSSLHTMLSNIPVRSDSEEWDKCDNEMYEGREIFQTPIIKGVVKTTEKEDYILKDPNVDNSSPNYTPVVAQKTTTLELGDYTHQRFSGQWSQRQRANTLKKRSMLVTAIIEALKTCNEVEAINSEITSDKIFDFLFSDK